MRNKLHILHLEDNTYDSELVSCALLKSGLAAEVRVARDRGEFLNAIEKGQFDVVLSDNSLPGFDGAVAMRMVREKRPGTPFIFVSSFANREDALAKKNVTGATDCISKAELDSLTGAIARALESQETEHVRKANGVSNAYTFGMERLIAVVQELSLARELNQIMAIVRHAARELTGADGATFVLRDVDKCHYADEEAIAPLWKGKRFPMSACISGWAMLNRQSVVIKDIYADARIPADAYRPTFVKSLVMVPIRTAEPIGAIGAYWATQRQPLPHEVKLLQALADSTSIAMENVQLYSGLERKVTERTAQLKLVNDELEAFSHSVSHDLRAPLRHISAYVEMLKDESGNSLNETGRRHLTAVADASKRMGTLINDLLEFSRMGRAEFRASTVDMNQLVAEVIAEQKADIKSRVIAWDICDLPKVKGDRALLKQVWVNLISNAVKYTRKRARAEIRIGGVGGEGECVFYVQDNGAGFDMQYADNLFGTFQRLHRMDEFEGTGIGLASVRRVINRHGGRTWAKAEVDQGATFYFTLPLTT